MPYINPNTVQQVKRIDLLEYLQEREPDELVRLGPASWRTKTHDSLKLSNGKWYWWSRGIGGRSALDYLIKVRDMTFTDAVQLLAEDDIAPAPYAISEPRSKVKGFRLPPKSSGKATRRYLLSRGIDPDIVDACMASGLVYGSNNKGHENVVFVGRDAAGTPRYASIRGCRGCFKGEAPGSDKRFSFQLKANASTEKVCVFESAIDALSFATVLVREGGNWRSYNLLSLGGVASPKQRAPCAPTLPPALAQYLADNPGTARASLFLDNDEAGRAAAKGIMDALKGRCEAVAAHPPVGKDVNDLLLLRYGRTERNKDGHYR